MILISRRKVKERPGFHGERRIKNFCFIQTVSQKGAADLGPFQVIEEQEGIEADILRRLARHGRSLGQIPTADHPALLVVSPRAAAHGDGRPERCRMALLPGDTTLPGWDLQAASAVSYGSGPKNTLTLSSREGRKLWLALQRELVTIQGQVVDRQEFPWTLDHGASPQSALAVAGALLLLGVPPEQLSVPHFPA